MTGDLKKSEGLLGMKTKIAIYKKFLAQEILILGTLLADEKVMANMSGSGSKERDYRSYLSGKQICLLIRKLALGFLKEGERFMMQKSSNHVLQGVGEVTMKGA